MCGDTHENGTQGSINLVRIGQLGLPQAFFSSAASLFRI
jgi:hypothetical protein